MIDPSFTPPVDLRAVAPELTYPLRQAWLRAHQTLSEVAFDGDQARGALHLAASRTGRVVAVASLLPEPPAPTQGAPALPGDWRLRGMATAPEARRQGLASALIARCAEHAIALGGTALWCHARALAVPFYDALGFVALGSPFQVDSIGLHVFMWRSL